MKTRTSFWIISVSILYIFSGCGKKYSGDPLPSWNEGKNKQTIIEFVRDITDKSHPDFVPQPERIAVFDNDGTLWAEQPVYFQILFTMDRLKTMIKDHPEWRKQPFIEDIMENDIEALKNMTEVNLISMLMATHVGMTTDEFEQKITDWIETAKHPELNLPLTSLVYQPMLELLEYLRDNGFKTYIVSAGGVEFMRPWTEKVYGIPPEQVIGSSIKTRWEIRDGEPVLVRLPEFFFIDNKEGKPIGINKFIGRKPIVAFGNSNDDLQMLQYTASGQGKSLMGLIHHDDDQREYAYDRESKIGHLDKALDEANEKGWMVVSMKNDFKQIFPKHN